VEIGGSIIIPLESQFTAALQVRSLTKNFLVIYNELIGEGLLVSAFFPFLVDYGQQNIIYPFTSQPMKLPTHSLMHEAAASNEGESG